MYFFKFFGLTESPTAQPIPSVGEVWIFSGTAQFIWYVICKILEEKVISTVKFFEHTREMKIAFKNWRIQEIRGKITVFGQRGGDNFWFKLSRGLKKLGFEKSGFHCKMMY